MQKVIAPLISMAALLALPGCLSRQLQFTTMRLTSTLPDLNQKQVLSNIARIAHQPTLLPYFAMITDGLSDVKDEGRFDASFDTVVGEFTKGTYAPGATRSLEGNWSLKPTVNPDHLLAMRGAYHIALGLPLTADEAAMLQNFLGKDGPALVPPKFVCVGTWRDVPRHDVAYVDHFGHTYVWVPQERAEEFSQFTLVIMKIYLNKLGEQNQIAPKGDPQQFREMHRDRSDDPARILSPDFPSNGFNPGLFLVPRG